MQVLDLCAGSGGKTLAMAALMENRGQIHAFDFDPARLAPMRQRLQRAGAHNVKILPAGSSDALARLDDGMDVVLVDAPCSGSGTWRRKPDSKWRLTQAQLDERIKEQRGVLEQGARAVRPGGVLVYVTCSILPQENMQQVGRFLDDHSAFSLLSPQSRWKERADSPLPVSAINEEKVLQLTPANNGTDGFFIALLQRS